MCVEIFITTRIHLVPGSVSNLASTSLGYLDAKLTLWYDLGLKFSTSVRYMHLLVWIPAVTR
jgi:hypothetical protein